MADGRQKRIIDLPGYSHRKARKVMVPAAGAALGLAANALQRFAQRGGFSSILGGGNGSGSVVTTQNDFKYSRSKTMSKKQRKRVKKIKKMVRRRRKKFRIKIHKALRPRKYYCKFIQNIGRSYISPLNGSTAVLIPIYGWRGGVGSAATDSVSSSVPTTTSPTIRSDQHALFRTFYDQARFFPTGTTTNASVAQWWYKHHWSALDISIVNSGATNEGPATNINRQVPIEYEIYKVYPGKKCPTDSVAPTLNTLGDIFNYADAQSQLYGAAPAGTFANYVFGDPGYTPWKQEFSSSFIKGKKIGEGYINPGGGAARFRFLAKNKNGYYSRMKIEKMDNGVNDTNRGFYPGHAVFIAIVFRGVSNGGSGVNLFHPQARLSFLMNWQHKTSSSGETQPGADTRYLSADSYA